MTLAMRVSRPEAFAMKCGVIVPVDAALIDEMFEEVQGRVRGEPDTIANDRRFATAILPCCRHERHHGSNRSPTQADHAYIDRQNGQTQAFVRHERSQLIAESLP